MAPSASGRQFLRTLGLVALAIAVTFTIDTFLAKTEQAETKAEAARLYSQGRSLLDQQQFDQAADLLQDALAIERNNHDYLLALAQAQLGGGKFMDAEMTLDILLLADSTDGPANLTLARVLVKEGRTREAISYYHRAVYGSWSADAAQKRLQARFELIDLLARQNSREELLGELLAVEDQFPSDVATRLRMGQLFLEAASPARAAAIFEEIRREQPGNAAAYAGLGEANFARADYRTAAADFSIAIRLNPGDRTSAARLEVSNRVLALDPTLRGLDPAERLRRSRALLEMTMHAVQACASGDLIEKAQKAVDARTPPGRQEAGAETDLDLAEQLWQGRTKTCGESAEDAVALVLGRTAQLAR